MDNETQKVVIIDDEPTTLLSLESAVESIADGFITINAAGDVTFVNPVAMSYSATLARVGGDEFACLLTEIGSGYSADSIAMAFLKADREPINIVYKAHQLSCAQSSWVSLRAGLFYVSSHGDGGFFHKVHR